MFFPCTNVFQNHLIHTSFKTEVDEKVPGTSMIYKFDG